MGTDDNNQHGACPEDGDGRLTDSELESVSYRYPSGKSFVVPFVLSVVALVAGLCGQYLPFVGAVIGIVALLLRHVSGVPRDCQKAPRAATVLAIAGILASFALSLYDPRPGTISLTIDAPEWRASYGDITVRVTGETDQGSEFQDTLEVTPNTPHEITDYETGTYSFSIDDDDLEMTDVLFESKASGSEPDAECTLGLEQDVNVSIPLVMVPLDGELTFSLGDGDVPNDTNVASVSVSGTTEEGESFSDSFQIAFGETKDLSSYPSGDYTFTVEPGSFTVDDTVYVISSYHVAYNNRDDEPVLISAKVDEQATQELAQQRAAERAAAEEAQRQQEEAAAAEAQRQQESYTQPVEQTVYITDTGLKYHRSGCRYLRQSSHPISLSSAKAQGYTACKVCSPPQ